MPTLWSIAFALVPVYPWTVYLSGLVLGWRFGRGRMVLTLLVLLIADQALLAWAPAHSYPIGSTRAVYDVIALLLPLNLVALSWTPERGLLTVPARLVALAVALQALLVFGLSHPRMAPLAAWLDYRIVHAHLGATPQLALLLFLAGVVVLALRFVRRPTPTEAGAIWTFVAALIGVGTGGGGIASSIYFATGGLVLIVSFIETSHGLAYTDELTGLPARRGLNETLAGLTGSFTIAMVDIDHFKRFNDQYGHDVGDQLLRMIGATLSRVGGGGQPFRYGGEEFAVVFDGLSAEQAMPHLETLRQTIEATSFTVRGRNRPRTKPEKPRPPDTMPRTKVSVTVSIGVAEAERGQWTPEEVLAGADEALYRAKRAGRNRIRT
ncbi:MAG: diguanylate cyclase [Candidatus Rokuibacteriota bacterium]